MNESMQAMEEEVSEQALCRTCGSDAGGEIACPDCDDESEDVCRACGGLGTITCPDC
jgi:hypothetical protein